MSMEEYNPGHLTANATNADIDIPALLLASPLSRLARNVAAAEFTFKEVVLAITAILFVGNLYVEYRQYRKHLDFTYTSEIAQLAESRTDFNKTQEYGQAKRLYSMFHSTFWFTLTAAILALDALSLLWMIAGKVVTSQYGRSSEILQSLVFVTLYSLPQNMLSIPFDYYFHFRLEEKYGFNKMTLGTFAKDFVKTQALQVVFGLPLVALFVSVVRWAATDSIAFFCGALWILGIAVHLAFMALFPMLKKIFNKFEPLKAGSLRTRIEELAVRIDFPLSRLLVVDGSKRSGHSNAYFFGFWNKQIVLFDTLLTQLDESETLAVLAHELGHWKLWHSYLLAILSHSYTLILFLMFGVVFTKPTFADSFAFGSHPHDIAADSWNLLEPAIKTPVLPLMILFSLFFSPVDVLVTFFINAFSRQMEFAADGYSVTLGFGQYLPQALKKISSENAGALVVDPLYATLHYTHPPLVERLRGIEAKIKKE